VLPCPRHGRAATSGIYRETGDRAGWIFFQLQKFLLAASPGGGRDWGVCTECGMGRASREEIPALLDLHRLIIAAR
jgi:hypothetical protein